MTRDRLARIGWLLLPLAAAFATSFCGGSGNPAAPPSTLPVTTPTTTTPPPPAFQPLSASCARLAAGTPAPPGVCGRETPTFQEDLNWAIDTLYDEHPEYFDGFQIHNVGAYFVGVIKNLDRVGICGYTANGEEFGIKTSSDLGEQYDIMGGRATVRRFYLYTCRPAAFPIDEPPLMPPPAGCTLAPSRSVACGEPPPVFYEDVDGAIGQLLSQRPELFDFSDVTAGTRWPRIVSLPAYQNALGEILRAKGYCGLYDGEEISIKKGTNEFSEQYDINYQDKYIRRGDGIYKGACYPAIF